ncbi:hypothetical protein T05_9287 [Trichinella murrelli]|uniref:Uncharacterized protein n=1 Tax=Trichinella murrelli TaxID=144512 RepID=A0A0V0TJ83_9BILA|nr:hypothetical protein T05_9318 [Trichinella murrelli]KRX39084.1 hypothetical protein T05_9287 [Trichinella murrelli]
MVVKLARKFDILSSAASVEKCQPSDIISVGRCVIFEVTYLANLTPPGQKKKEVRRCRICRVASFCFHPRQCKQQPCP